jgi:hypothetical protein
MNCKRAQAQVALAVGGDLDDAAERELQEHLESCPGCRRHEQQMTDTWELLLDREDEPADPHDSVWPDLQVRLPDRREFFSRARFNGGVVALCVAAVLLAMVSIWRTANTSATLLDGSDGIAEIDAVPETPRMPLPRLRAPSRGFVPVVTLPGQGESVLPSLELDRPHWRALDRRPPETSGPPF